MEERINGEKGIWIGLCVFICLAIVKILVGISANSQALKADGLNNSTDILVTIAILIGLKISKKPADQDHAYGHTRAEMIAALIASFIMVSVGIQVIIQAISLLYKGSYQTPDLSAAWVALGGAVALFLVYRYNRSLAKKTNSQAIMAAAKDSLSDAWVSIGTALGIFFTQIGLPWLDPVMALLIGGIICYTAWSIFYEATHTLTDGFDPNKLKPFIHTISGIDGVEKVAEIKARSNGNKILLDVVIKVDPHLNVIESHAISEAVESELARIHQITDAVIHIEPVGLHSSSSNKS